MSDIDAYGEWTIGLAIRVILASGEVESWSEERQAVGFEDAARRTAESKLRATIRLQYPDARKIEVVALASNLVADHFPQP